MEEGSVEGSLESEGTGEEESSEESSGTLSRAEVNASAPGRAQVNIKQSQQSAGKAQAKPADEDDLSEEYLDKKVTITVDGEKHRMSVREAMKVQQLEKASRAKMNQAAQQDQKVRALLKQIEDPREYFRLRGIDLEDFAEKTLTQKLALLQESPEQREMRETKERLARYEEREKAEKDALEKETHTKAEQEAQQKFNSEFVETWKATGLPPDRLFGQFVAAELVAANARREALSLKDAAGKVKDKFQSAVSQIVSQMDPEGIQKLLGKETLKKIREYEVNRISQGTTPTANSGPRLVAKSSDDGSTSKGQGKSKAMNEQEYRKWWNS